MILADLLNIITILVF